MMEIVAICIYNEAQSAMLSLVAIDDLEWKRPLMEDDTL